MTELKLLFLKKNELNSLRQEDVQVINVPVKICNFCGAVLYLDSDLGI